jgi:hypothetical protein
VGQANYGAAKAGIISLTTIAAMEMARYGGDGQRDLADRPDPDARRHRRAAVEAEELLTGLPEVYGTAPSGRLPSSTVPDRPCLLGRARSPVLLPVSWPHQKINDKTNYPNGSEVTPGP